jgi:hypothetical protein
MVLLMRMLLPNLEFGKISLVAARSSLLGVQFGLLWVVHASPEAFLQSIHVVQLLVASSSAIPGSFGKCLELVWNEMLSGLSFLARACDELHCELLLGVRRRGQ